MTTGKDILLLFVGSEVVRSAVLIVLFKLYITFISLLALSKTKCCDQSFQFIVFLNLFCIFRYNVV